MSSDFVPFTVGGFPDPERSKEIIRAFIRSGADAVELGIPFSDPMADGPTIQKADQKALQNGVKPGDVLEIAAEFPDTEIIVMAYANTLRSYGYKSFLEDAEEADVDGLIVPDMPPEEYRRELAEIETSVDQNFLVAQNTPEERVREIAELTDSFLYLVSVRGTTGSRDEFSGASRELVEKTSHIDTPRYIGFGISSPEHAREAVGDAGADGVIMGSALLEAYMDGGIDEMEELASSVAEVVR